MVNALLLLKRDHNNLRELFKLYQKTSSEAFQTKKDVFDQIKEELDKHTLIEEEIFYPAMRDAQKSSELIDPAIDQHNAVKSLLAEISAIDPRNEEFDGKIRYLIEQVQHHVWHEEKVLFKVARELFVKSSLEELGRQLAARKNQVIVTRDINEGVGVEA